MKKLLPIMLFCLMTALSQADTFQVEPLKSFTVTLESNRMTGYHWELVKPVDPRYLVFIAKKYYKPAYKMSQNMGYEKWEFKAISPGETAISLKYTQPWAEDTAPLRTQEIRVKIMNKDRPKAKPAEEASVDQLELALKEKSGAVIRAMIGGEYLDLAQSVHPDKGVRFSPYGSKLNSQDLVFSREEVARFITDKRQYYWGKYESSGQLIKLTIADYFKTFVKDRDFSKAKQVKYFPITEKSKSLAKFYKGDVVVEYYLPGSGSKWNSLRLIFEKVDEQYYLVGVLHDGWTI